MKTLDLKPCPFCGGEAYLIYTMSFGEECRSVHCIKCKAKINNFRGINEKQSEELAINAWNRRVKDENV